MVLPRQRKEFIAPNAGLMHSPAQLSILRTDSATGVHTRAFIERSSERIARARRQNTRSARHNSFDEKKNFFFFCRTNKRTAYPHGCPP